MANKTTKGWTSIEDFKNNYWGEGWHKYLKFKKIKENENWILLDSKSKPFNPNKKLPIRTRYLINKSTENNYYWNKWESIIRYHIIDNIRNAILGKRNFDYYEMDIDKLLDEIMIEEL